MLVKIYLYRNHLTIVLKIQTHPPAVVLQHFHFHVVERADVVGGEDGVGRAAVADLPVLHGDNVVGVVRGVVDVVQHDHDGFAVVVHRLAQVRHQVARVVHIEVVQRFVQQYVIGVLGEGHGDQRALPLSAGERVDVGVAQFAEVEVGERVFDDVAVVAARAAPVVGVAGEGEQFFDGEAAHEAGLLLQYRQFARDVVAVAGGDVEGVHLDLAALDGGEAGDMRQQGAFARAVRADEGNDAAGREFEVDMLQDGFAADVVVQVVDGNHGCLRARSR